MANPKRGFIIYFDNYPMLIKLPPDQRGWLITALIEYAQQLSCGDGKSLDQILERYPPLSPQTRTTLQFMAAAADRDTQRWMQRRQAALERRQSREGERPTPQALQQEQADRERLLRALKQARAQT